LTPARINGRLELDVWTLKRMLCQGLSVSRGYNSTRPEPPGSQRRAARHVVYALVYGPFGPSDDPKAVLKLGPSWGQGRALKTVRGPAWLSRVRPRLGADCNTRMLQSIIKLSLAFFRDLRLLRVDCNNCNMDKTRTKAGLSQSLRGSRYVRNPATVGRDGSSTRGLSPAPGSQEERPAEHWEEVPCRELPGASRERRGKPTFPVAVDFNGARLARYSLDHHLWGQYAGGRISGPVRSHTGHRPEPGHDS
jgi:hypothetical protein